MGVVFQPGYTLPSADQPLTHARIAHSGNWFSGGTVAASSTGTGYFAAAPNNSLTYERWKPSALDGSGQATWEVDYGEDKTADYFALAAHDFATQGATLTCQYWDGSAWVDLIADHAPTDNMPIFVIFQPVTAEKFRIVLETATAEVGVVKFGSALQMQQPIYAGHSPIDLSRQTVIRSNYSETGEFLGKTKQRTYGSSAFAWEHLTADWVRTNWRPFQLALESEPFFIAWRPLTFSEVAFGQSDSIPVPTNMGVKNYMSVSLSMRSRGYD